MKRYPDRKHWQRVYCLIGQTTWGEWYVLNGWVRSPHPLRMQRRKRIEENMWHRLQVVSFPFYDPLTGHIEPWPDPLEGKRTHPQPDLMTPA